jgi:hypothetical protein
MMKQLGYAINEAARTLINGEIDESAAVRHRSRETVGANSPNSFATLAEGIAVDFLGR